MLGFPKLSNAKLKHDVFTGPDIGKLTFAAEFDGTINEPDSGSFRRNNF